MEGVSLRLLGIFLEKYKPSIVGFLETRCSSMVAKNKLQRLGYDQISCSDNQGFAGGIWVGWKSDQVDVTVLNHDFQFIHMKIKEANKPTWLLTVAYVSPREDVKAIFWEKMANIAEENTEPWVIMGDLNDILEASEKKGGAPVNSRKCDRFRDRIDKCCLMDVVSQGHRYTWKGPCTRGYMWVFERLDRALCNSAWRMLNEEAFVQVLTRVDFSDHHPLILKLNNIRSVGNNRPFRFESCWLTHPDFRDFVKNKWSKEDQFHLALNNLSHNLDDWNKNTFGHIKKRKFTILDRLGGIQRSTSWNPFLERLERQLQEELSEVCKQEEYLWHQKARTEWIKSGDRNIKFYHLKTTNRRRRNRVCTIKNDEGIWLDDEVEIQNHVVSFYKDLFTEDRIGDLMGGTMITFPTINQNDDDSLRRDISDDEIRKAIFAMGALKAPGDDGFPALFYHSNWDVVGSNLCSFVKKAYNEHGNGHIREVNQTLLVLIPKISQPVNIKQFRPISLCNVTYKTLTKVIVGRLKTILPYIISPYQASFVPRRCIQDNIIIAQEMIHSMKRMKAKKGFMTIKVDLEKAYYRLSWDFIHKTLKETNIPVDMINVIMECITSSSLNTLWNGRKTEVFHPTRGIRQGDPLSPYIFVICIDKLSHIIVEAISKKEWSPMRVGRSGPEISHLMFADDLLLFSEASKNHVEQVMNCLNKFCTMFGQKVSGEKTSIFFSKNVRQEIRQEICISTGFKNTTNLGDYLGAPIIHGRAGRETYKKVIRTKSIILKF